MLNRKYRKYWAEAFGSFWLVFGGAATVLYSAAVPQAGVGYLKKGILVSLVGLSILLGKLSLHRHLNQNDLYHLVQMLGLFLFYRGALLLHGLEVKKSPKT